MAKTKKKSTFERLRHGELNRKQRRNLARRLAGNDPGLTIIHANAAGLTSVMRVTSNGGVVCRETSFHDQFLDVPIGK